MKRTIFTLTCALTALLFAAGCATEQEVRKYKLQLGVPHGSKKYAPLNTNGLYLYLLSKPLLYAGSESTLTFALRNTTAKNIDIQEWFRHEPDNLVLYIQPYLPDMQVPDPDSWFEIRDPRKRPVMHFPATLMPDNQLLITKKLEFISKMTVSPGKERRFFLKAVSAMESVKLESEIIVLRVLPKNTKGVKQK